MGMGVRRKGAFSRGRAGRALVLKLGCGYLGSCSAVNLYTPHTGYKYPSVSIYIFCIYVIRTMVQILWVFKGA